MRLGSVRVDDVGVGLDAGELWVSGTGGTVDRRPYVEFTLPEGWTGVKLDRESVLGLVRLLNRWLGEH